MHILSTLDHSFWRRWTRHRLRTQQETVNAKAASRSLPADTHARARHCRMTPRRFSDREACRGGGARSGRSLQITARLPTEPRTITSDATFPPPTRLPPFPPPPLRPGDPSAKRLTCRIGDAQRPLRVDVDEPDGAGAQGLLTRAVDGAGGDGLLLWGRPELEAVESVLVVQAPRAEAKDGTSHGLDGLVACTGDGAEISWGVGDLASAYPNDKRLRVARELLRQERGP